MPAINGVFVNTDKISKTASLKTITAHIFDDPATTQDPVVAKLEDPVKRKKRLQESEDDYYNALGFTELDETA